MASIRKRGNNSYLVTVSCGYDAQGKKLTRTKTFKKPTDMTEKKWEKEIEKLALEFELEVEKGLHLDGGKLSLADFTELWIRDYAEKNLAPKTLARYKEILHTRVVPALGHIKLEKLRPNHLLEFYDNLSEKGIRLDDTFFVNPNFKNIIEKKNLSLGDIAESSDLSIRTVRSMMNGNTVSRKTAMSVSKALGLDMDKLFVLKGEPRGLSDRTIKHHHRVISSMLTTAVYWQFITDNVAKRVKPPKVERSRAEFYDESETERLLILLEDAPLKYKAALHLVIFGGMRLGELSGLEWDHVDFDNSLIRIMQAAQYLPGEGSFIKDTKNTSSDRVISMPASVMALLKQYKAWQNEQRLKCGDLWNEDWDANRWMFTQWNDKRIYYSTIAQWFSKFRKENNLPKLTFHQLRHTNASLLIGLGTNIQTVSKRLGHARASTTTDIYSHALQRPDREAADMLENLFNKNNKAKQA